MGQKPTKPVAIRIRPTTPAMVAHVPLREKTARVSTAKPTITRMDRSGRPTLGFVDENDIAIRVPPIVLVGIEQTNCDGALRGAVGEIRCRLSDEVSTLSRGIPHTCGILGHRPSQPAQHGRGVLDEHSRAPWKHSRPSGSTRTRHSIA